MKRIALIAVLSIGSISFSPESFREQQKKAPRVKISYKEKEQGVKELLAAKNIDPATLNLFIRVFKQEARLELWAKSKNQTQFILLRGYNICSSSGELGPKRKQGDGQVPEGFYHIDRFNPYSNFYLSLGINYPNQSDNKLAEKGNPGGDIFIHGSCVTIGCLPMTDDKIKEIYLIAVEAKSNGQEKIPVHIFPCSLNEDGVQFLAEKYRTNIELIRFWTNLKSGFDYFEKHKILPKVTVDITGRYIFN